MFELIVPVDGTTSLHLESRVQGILWILILLELLNLDENRSYSLNGSFTLREMDSGTDSDSDPIPVVGS